MQSEMPKIYNRWSSWWSRQCVQMISTCGVVMLWQVHGLTNPFGFPITNIYYYCYNGQLKHTRNYNKNTRRESRVECWVRPSCEYWMLAWYSTVLSFIIFDCHCSFVITLISKLIGHPFTTTCHLIFYTILFSPFIQ